MIRFILVAVTLFGFLAFSIPILILEWVIGKFDSRKRDWDSLHIVQATFRFIVRLTGSSITVKGLENIPKDQAVLYVGNHRSYFDILTGYITVPGLTGFIAKKEMLRYPVLRNWMSYVHCLFLDRSDMKKALKTILKGIESIKDGISIWIFPEGTRNRKSDPLDMLPFKEGSLKIAEKSGCPVIPVAITGTQEIFESHIPFMRPSQVVIQYGKPIYLKELAPEDRKFCGAYTQKIILQMLSQELREQAANQKEGFSQDDEGTKSEGDEESTRSA